MCSNGDISKLLTERLTFGVEGIVGLVAGHDFSGAKLVWWPNVRCLVFGYLFLVFFGLLMLIIVSQNKYGVMKSQ